MDTVDRTKAARAGAFLYRYMWARRRCVGGAAPAGRLTSVIQWGRREYDGIDVEPNADPPIVRDRRHPAFFAAIIEQDDTALPKVSEMAAWRSYVLDNGPLPREGELEPTAPVTSESPSRLTSAA